MREMEEAAHCVKIEFGSQVPLTFTTHFSACEQAQSTLSSLGHLETHFYK